MWLKALTNVQRSNTLQDKCIKLKGDSFLLSLIPGPTSFARTNLQSKSAEPIIGRGRMDLEFSPRSTRFFPQPSLYVKAAHF